MVHDDIKAKKLEKTSVVNLSMSLELKSAQGTTGVSQAMINKMGKFKVFAPLPEIDRQIQAVVIKALIADGVTVVTGSRNRFGRIPGYPGKFGESSHEHYMPDLIVVGGVRKRDGDVNDRYSTGRPRPQRLWHDGFAYDVDVWAPSESLNCPNAVGGMDIGSRQGTSFGE